MDRVYLPGRETRIFAMIPRYSWLVLSFDNYRTKMTLRFAVSSVHEENVECLQNSRDTRDIILYILRN